MVGRHLWLEDLINSHNRDLLCTLAIISLNVEATRFYKYETKGKEEKKRVCGSEQRFSSHFGKINERYRTR